MAQRYKAFLQQTNNSRYVVMVQAGNDIMEISGNSVLLRMLFSLA